MFRFDAKKRFYLYPQSRSDDNIELRMNSGTTYEKNVWLYKSLHGCYVLCIE